MLVVDASCLYEVLIDAPHSELVRQRLFDDSDHVAPSLIDVEVLHVIRRDLARGVLDRTTAHQAVEDLRTWPGERFGHRSLLERSWELRTTVRTSDAIYVALAEAMSATLVTLDARLAHALGPNCPVELLR